MLQRKLAAAMAALLSLSALSGCANVNLNSTDPGQRALAGAAIGAGSGAVLGGAVAGWDGAAVGAAVGGVAGAITGAATTPAPVVAATPAPYYAPRQ